MLTAPSYSKVTHRHDCLPNIYVSLHMICNVICAIICTGMFTIPTASLAGAQLVSAGSGTNGSNNGQGTVTVTLPMAGNMVNTGGMVMVSALVFQFTTVFVEITVWLNLCVCRIRWSLEVAVRSLTCSVFHFLVQRWWRRSLFMSTLNNITGYSRGDKHGPN